MRCFSAQNSYVTALCIYAYSYTIFIPVIILCSSGYVVTQWIFLAYGFFHSTSFIIVNYWRELGKYVDKLRIIIIFIFISSIVFSLEFFKFCIILLFSSIFASKSILFSKFSSFISFI